MEPLAITDNKTANRGLEKTTIDNFFDELFQENDFK